VDGEEGGLFGTLGGRAVVAGRLVNFGLAGEERLVYAAQLVPHLDGEGEEAGRDDALLLGNARAAALIIVVVRLALPLAVQLDPGGAVG
jgi:hypothetical protein